MAVENVGKTLGDTLLNVGGKMLASDDIVETTNQSTSELTELAGVLEKNMKKFSFLEGDHEWSGCKKEKRLMAYDELKQECDLLVKELANLAKVIQNITQELLNANEKTSEDDKYIIGSNTLGTILKNGNLTSVIIPGLTTFGGVFRSPFSQNLDLKLNSDYGMRYFDGSGFEYHQGMDLVPLEKGSDKTLYALADGEVVYNQVYGTAGHAIIIKYPDPLNQGKYIYVEYYHMVKNLSHLKEGTKVTAGQVVGTMGNSGRSTATHLHLNVRVGDENSTYKTATITDPAKYFFPELYEKREYGIDVSNSDYNSNTNQQHYDKYFLRWGNIDKSSFIPYGPNKETLGTKFKSQTPDVIG